MKKRVFLSLFIVLMLFIVTGCESSKKEESNKTENEVVDVDPTLFKIKDKEFHLDTEKEFKGLKYKVSSEFREINNGSPSSVYMQYNYQPEGSSNYFYLRILYYIGKDINFAKNDYVGNEEKFEFEDVKINDIECKMIDEKRTDGTIHHYFITKDKSTFIVDFISQNDIKDYEKKTLATISF